MRGVVGLVTFLCMVHQRKVIELQNLLLTYTGLSDFAVDASQTLNATSNRLRVHVKPIHGFSGIVRVEVECWMKDVRVE